ncbi:MAG: xanthine dehydrogenase family protein molybdopterin-binding subunit [Nitrososphaerota archaeon]|nr:xanthine dehydrogenase family protein molybdopterin-binding subunit [Nitrososphaerota archaeon]
MDIQPSDIGLSANTGMLYMGYVTCPYPNAIIKSIDTSAAEAMGAITLTALDYDFLPPNDYYSSSGLHTRGPLPWPQVRSPGQFVVAVAHTSPDLVNDAIQLVKVEYEPLPYVFDAVAALQPDAPQLWPNGNSPSGSVVEGQPTPSTAVVQFGNVDAAFAAADAVVNLPILDTQWINHFDFEPRGLIAQWTNAGTINIYCNSQYVYGIRPSIANYFFIPQANINVIESVGGDDATGGGQCGNAFGNKTSGEEYVIATAMSKKSGLAVKFGHTRYTHATATTDRFPFRGYVSISGKNGLITGIRARIYVNTGALSGAESERSELYATYNIPSVDLISYSATTNAYSQASPMRDVGESQCSLLTETAVDMLAEKLNIDPATIRLNNMRTNGYTDPVTGQVFPDTAFDPSTGRVMSSLAAAPAYFVATRGFNWSSRWKGWGVPSGTPVNTGSTQGTGQKLRGIGIALTSGAKGSMGSGTGKVTVTQQGGVTAYIGSQENGAGQSTTQVIITGECLGFTPDMMGNIRAMESDTRYTPNTGGTYGSMQTRTCGLSMISACQNLGSQWFPLVAPKLVAGTDPANLNFGNNTIYDTTNPNNSMSWKDACALLPSTGLTGTGPAGGPSGVAYRVAGTKICEVEIDVETADVRVIDYMGCLAVGRQIFASGLRGQNQGGFLGMGLGEALYEETINDSSTGLKYSGTRLNPNYLDFKIPTIMQVPDNFQVPVYEQVDPVGPFGAVGMGENALTGVASMVLNALSNACGGYRFTRMPVRKEDIVDALQWMKDNGKLPK